MEVISSVVVGVASGVTVCVLWELSEHVRYKYGLMTRRQRISYEDHQRIVYGIDVKKEN